MLLNTLEFMLFFPFIAILYWVIPMPLRQWHLLFTSYAMYLIATSVLATITIFFVTCATYTIPIMAEKYPSKNKFIYSTGCILSLLPLLTLKYTFFAMESFRGLASHLDLIVSIPKWQLLLPIGISFYTFQALSYTLDVAQGKRKPENNFIQYALFVSFFPQIVSGPISKSSELLSQIKSPTVFNETLFNIGAKRILYGLFLKFVIADRVAIYVDSIFNSYNNYSGLTCFAASVCYSIQIYADFAGYSLLAIGVANTLGINIIENFRRPYLAQSVTDFWRRWHISLSRWLRDYVYIQLGGSRRSKIRTYINILITFFVSGIWHGANWTFVIWGLIHGILQCFEKLVGLNNIQSQGFVKVIRIVITFLLINFAWIFFRMPNISDALAVTRKIIFQPLDGVFVGPSETTMGICILIGILCLIAKELRDEFIPEKMKLFDSSNIAIRFTSYIATLFIILLIGVLDGGQFIYASF